MPVLLPAPPSLPRPNGPRPSWGRFLGPVPDVDTSAWDRLARRRRAERKSWTFVGAFSERFLVGVAVADAGYAGSAFAYVKDRLTGDFVERKALVPLAFPSDHQPSLATAWRLDRGRASWSMSPTAEGGTTAACHAAGLDVEVAARPGPGVSVIAPAHGRPFNFTFKAAPLPARVTVRRAGTVVTTDALAVLDFSKGYPPRHAFWNWLAVTGRADDGRAFAANLVAEYNNGLENVAWLGDDVIPLAQAVFEYDARDVLAPWRVRTLDGALDLAFVPEGARRDRVRAGLLSHRFAQPFGRAEGTLHAGGRVVRVTGNGVVEEHESAW